ncbi:GNAT family N-acetyltransferase [Rhodobacteraceae bacterium D3-12]|nr:GNAT family N-acetyltransferase [Rhodobacteraceae bacterium D3-12]
MTLSFRPLTDADLPAAAALWHEGWIAGHADFAPPDLIRLRTLESFHDRLSRHMAQTFIAADADRLLGFVMLHDNEIDQFYVAQSARGTGTASALMGEAEARLRAAGHTAVWLACSVGNDRAARFYEKSGWRRGATKDMTFETTAGPFPITIWRYEKTL